jgi:hypothetical protein
MNELSYEAGSFFGRPVTDARKRNELGVLQVTAQLGGGVDRDSTIAIAPHDEGWGIEMVAKRAAQASHIVVPRLEQAEQMEDGARGAEVIAVRLEALRCVPALGSGHAAETDHLQPLGHPGHTVSKELAGLGEVEADERVAFTEVRMRRRDEDKRTDRLTVVCGEAHGDGSAMGVTEEDGAMQVERIEDAADLLGGGGEAGVDVGAALGLAGSGEIKSDDVLVGVELQHEGDEGSGATHEAVEQNDRGLILGRFTLFEVREAKAVELNMLALNHLFCDYPGGF